MQREIYRNALFKIMDLIGGCSHVYELNKMHFDGTMNDMVGTTLSTLFLFQAIKLCLKFHKVFPHYLRYCRIDSLKDNNVCKVLYDCLLECFKIDLKYCI